MSCRTFQTTIDWRALTETYQVSRCCYHWVTDESITEALRHLHFDDPAVPHTPETNRARRIASIVLLMKAGVAFDPLLIKVSGTKVHLKDGHHRLRAHQFRGTLSRIRVCVYGY
jgi:hypothetical protein